MAELDLAKLQKTIYSQYEHAHVELGEQGTLDHLERGKQFDLSGTLKNGGVLVFPHTSVQDCGYQVAACVHACLDSGADQVLVISVLHAFTNEMKHGGVLQQAAIFAKNRHGASKGRASPDMTTTDVTMC